MAESVVSKLVVEVCNAKNLMPKDGQGTASAYAIVDFDGQRRRTKTRFRDLNPQWDEVLEFSIHDADSLAAEVLEVNLYNDKKVGKKGTFLGKVKIAGSGFAKSGSEALVYYPLEKRSVFSQIKGEIGLKVYYVAVDPPVVAAEEQKAPEAEAEVPAAEGEAKVTEEAKGENAVEEKKEEEKPKEEEKKEEEKPRPPAEDAKPEEAPAKLPAEVEGGPVPPPEKSVESKVMADKSKVSVDDLDLRSLLSNRGRASYDLVDRMTFLFVRVVKSKRGDDTSKLPAYAKLMIGTHAVKTRTCVNDKDWDQVFAFDKEGLNSTNLEVSVWVEEKKENEEAAVEKCLGTVSFDLLEIPKRVPPDSPLAPQWYTLESDTSPGNDVMLATWLGSQADEAFQEAWQSDSGGMIPETRAKVYLAPKLWYLRLTVIQTQDLQLGSGPEPKVKSSSPRLELYVKGQLGPQVFKTSRTSAGATSSGSANPTWNEDLVFVAAEPFEPFLLITVEEAKTGNLIGRAKVHVAGIEKRIDSSSEPPSRWFNLAGDESKPYAGRIHVRVCLEGGYHVLDEAAHVASDVRASAKQLAAPPIGLLEVGIRGATNLLPVKTKDGMRGTADAYVVAKYGPKWVRTRTILDRFNPRWNEQYAWDVYDPCTVLTIGVFDNGRYKHEESGKQGKDVRIGKLRVRLSTLDTNRAYVNTYSLVALYPGGAKRMGEIEIAVRFMCSSWLSLVQAYSAPLLPKMHYMRPFGPAQQEILSHTAMRIVTARLARSEPPLGQEVVQFMLDSDSHIWSVRRSKANWFRIVGCLSRTGSFLRFLDGIRTWAHPSTTVLAHALWATAVLCPHLILPTVFMYAFLVLVLRFRYRNGAAPGGIDPRLSCADTASPDELDEEFDGFPTVRTPDAVRIRYDRLRALAGRTQAVMGDVAAQGERLEALLNWRDPRATGIFVAFCLMASLTFYAVPFKVIVMVAGFYFLRHPRFRHETPSVPVNFFRRLPSLSDQIM